MRQGKNNRAEIGFCPTSCCRCTIPKTTHLWYFALFLVQAIVLSILAGTGSFEIPLEGTGVVYKLAPNAGQALLNLGTIDGIENWGFGSLGSPEYHWADLATARANTSSTAAPDCSRLRDGAPVFITSADPAAEVVRSGSLGRDDMAYVFYAVIATVTYVIVGLGGGMSFTTRTSQMLFVMISALVITFVPPAMILYNGNGRMSFEGFVLLATSCLMQGHVIWTLRWQQELNGEMAIWVMFVLALPIVFIYAEVASDWVVPGASVLAGVMLLVWIVKWIAFKSSEVSEVKGKGAPSLVMNDAADFDDVSPGGAPPQQRSERKRGSSGMDPRDMTSVPSAATWKTVRLVSMFLLAAMLNFSEAFVDTTTHSSVTTAGAQVLYSPTVFYVPPVCCPRVGESLSSWGPKSVIGCSLQKWNLVTSAATAPAEMQNLINQPGLVESYRISANLAIGLMLTYMFLAAIGHVVVHYTMTHLKDKENQENPIRWVEYGVTWTVVVIITSGFGPLLTRDSFHCRVFLGGAAMVFAHWVEIGLQVSKRVSKGIKSPANLGADHPAWPWLEPLLFSAVLLLGVWSAIFIGLSDRLDDALVSGVTYPAIITATVVIVFLFLLVLLVVQLVHGCLVSQGRVRGEQPFAGVDFAHAFLRFFVKSLLAWMIYALFVV